MKSVRGLHAGAMNVAGMAGMVELNDDKRVKSLLEDTSVGFIYGVQLLLMQQVNNDQFTDHRPPVNRCKVSS
jgi:hypothetical protein